MALWQGKSKRKESGGRYWPFRKKRARDIGDDPIYTRLEKETKARQKRTRGGNRITSLLTASTANLCTAPGKYQQAKILKVKENPSNRHFVRMNVITRGTIVETDAGLAKVTSRPTRDGVVNAILIKK